MIAPEQLWDGVMRRLRAEMPAFTLKAWIAPLVAQRDGEVLRLVCPTAFHRDRVRERFLAQILACAEQQAGRALPVELVVGETAGRPGARPVTPATRSRVPAASRERGPASPGARRAAQPTLPYTFDSFVVGPCNALAREASVAVARAQQRNLNPLFLASGNGLGKTHLARAIVAAARDSQRALYASAETFTNEFMACLRSRQMARFKRRYRRECDLLVVEDVQFLGTKAATQLELFHTLAHLIDAGVRVVLSADRLPRDIEGLESRLCSQLTAGLVAPLERPDATVRREILRSKTAAGGVRLPDDCLDLLVDSIRGNVRDLEGVLIQLVSSAALLKRPIDLDLTRAALHKIAPSKPRVPRLAARAIICAVAAFFGTTPDALASRSRRRDVLVPRQLAMYLCRRYTDEPLAVIAQHFDRDHPAVSNAVRVVERRILERAPLRYQVEELTARLDKLATC